MIPLQEVNFHLSSNEVIFCQLVKSDSNTFAASVTRAHDKENLPEMKYFRWLACPAGANAEAAFKEVVSAIEHCCQKNDNTTLVKVNNPCNCEFLAAHVQQEVVGKNVSVVVNEPL